MAQKINLVLSGGGARGITYIGIIEVLEAHGFQIESISGTSMGALVAGIYAAGGLESYKQWLLNADYREAIKMLDFSLKLPGLIKGDKIMQKIKGMLQVQQIEDLPIPYAAVATDLNHNDEVVFTKGDLIEAMRASISIPTVFTPVFKDNQMLVDGGLVNNIPLNKVPENNYPVFAVCANANIPVSPELQVLMQIDNKGNNDYLKKLNQIRNHIRKYLNLKPLDNQPDNKTDEDNNIGYTDIIDKSLHLMITNASQKMIRTYPPDLLINIPHEIANTLDFLKADKLYKVGLYLAEQALAERQI